jgi:hypothetical protein
MVTLLKRWIPWKFFIKRIARSYGFIDLSFGQASTSHDDLNLKFLNRDQNLLMEGDALWHSGPYEVEIRVPGYRTEKIQELNQIYELEKIDVKNNKKRDI